MNLIDSTYHLSQILPCCLINSEFRWYERWRHRMRIGSTRGTHFAAVKCYLTSFLSVCKSFPFFLSFSLHSIPLWFLFIFILLPLFTLLVFTLYTTGINSLSLSLFLFHPCSLCTGELAENLYDPARCLAMALTHRFFFFYTERFPISSGEKKYSMLDGPPVMGKSWR